MKRVSIPLLSLAAFVYVAALTHGQYNTIIQSTGFGQSTVADWTPSDCTDCDSWWDAADDSTFTYSAGTTISQWDDKIGSNDLTPGANAPNHDTANDEVEIEPTGVGENIGNESMTNSSTDDWLICIVADYTNSTGFDPAVTERKVGDPRTEDRYILIGGQSSGVQARSLAGYTAKATNTNDFTGEMHVICSENNAGTGQIYIDGTAGTSATGMGSSADIDIVFGNSDNTNFDGTTLILKEAVWMVDATVTTARRECLSGYLAWRHGLDANLDAGHAYASAAPQQGDSNCP